MIKELAAFTLALMSSAAVAETPLERGKYLVDAVMACDGCHTPRPGGNFQHGEAILGWLAGLG
jgi:cytochrome c553